MRLGKYRISKKLHHDIIGTHYLAHSPDFAETVLIRLLHHAYAQDDELVQAFHRCAETYCYVENPNHLKAYEHGQEQNHHYLIQDYQLLDPLEKILEKRRVFATEDALEITDKLARILRSYHIEGIVHGTLSPQSIYADERLLNFKVSDLGFEEFFRLVYQKKSSLLKSTSPYYSPEWFRDDANLDRRSDIYSLGIIFYRMLIGDLPVRMNGALIPSNGTATTVIPPSLQRLEVPGSFDRIVLDALQPVPQKRYQNLSQVISDLSDAKSRLKARQSEVEALLKQAKQAALSEAVLSGSVPDAEAKTGIEDVERPKTEVMTKQGVAKEPVTDQQPEGIEADEVKPVEQRTHNEQNIPPFDPSDDLEEASEIETLVEEATVRALPDLDADVEAYLAGEKSVRDVPVDENEEQIVDSEITSETTVRNPIYIDAPDDVLSDNSIAEPIDSAVITPEEAMGISPLIFPDDRDSAFFERTEKAAALSLERDSEDLPDLEKPPPEQATIDKSDSAVPMAQIDLLSQGEQAELPVGIESESEIETEVETAGEPAIDEPDSLVRANQINLLSQGEQAEPPVGIESESEIETEVETAGEPAIDEPDSLVRGNQINLLSEEEQPEPTTSAEPEVSVPTDEERPAQASHDEPDNTALASTEEEPSSEQEPEPASDSESELQPRHETSESEEVNEPGSMIALTKINLPKEEQEPEPSPKQKSGSETKTPALNIRQPVYAPAKGDMTAQEIDKYFDGGTETEEFATTRTVNLQRTFRFGKTLSVLRGVMLVISSVAIILFVLALTTDFSVINLLRDSGASSENSKADGLQQQQQLTRETKEASTPPPAQANVQKSNSLEQTKATTSIPTNQSKSSAGSSVQNKTPLGNDTEKRSLRQPMDSNPRQPASSKPTLSSPNRPVIRDPRPAAPNTSQVENAASFSTSVHLTLNTTSGSQPLVANVYLDGAIYGKTNATGRLLIPNLEVKKIYILKIQQTGYQMWAREISFSRGGNRSLNIDLEKLPDPPPASIKSPISENLVNLTENRPVQPQRSPTMSQAKKNESNKAGAQAGGYALLDIKLSNPEKVSDAHIYINGERWEGEQFEAPARLELPVGDYVVEIRKEGYRAAPPSYSISLLNGESKSLPFFLIQK